MNLDSLVIALGRLILKGLFELINENGTEVNKNMTGKLSRLEDASVDDLKQISFSMQEYLSTENEATLQIAIEKIVQRPSLIASIFPNAYQKEQQAITLERMRSIARSRENLFNLYTSVRFEIAKKQSDALIASVGMNLQAKLTAFAAARIDEIETTIGESKAKFMERINHQRELLKQYEDFTELYEPARQSMVKEISTYYATIDNLLTGFVEALKTRVETSRK